MKQEIIKHIADLMYKHKISVKDILLTIDVAFKFDLLCEIDGHNVRLPFEEGYTEKIIGIFHNKKTDLYLHVDETQETLRKFAFEFKLPTLSYWEEIFEVKDELNKTLMILGFKELDGFYFARSSYNSMTNWIVGFKDGVDHLTSDYYENKEPAKIRYIGYCS